LIPTFAGFHVAPESVDLKTPVGKPSLSALA
jgi:hypothetical protein